MPAVIPEVSPDEVITMEELGVILRQGVKIFLKTGTVVNPDFGYSVIPEGSGWKILFCNASGYDAVEDQIWAAIALIVVRVRLGSAFPRPGHYKKVCGELGSKLNGAQFMSFDDLVAACGHV